MSVRLKVLRGASAGKEVAIQGPRFFIGRSEECNLRANSDAISRKHCAIVIEDQDVTIRDLGSQNGTYVNGSRIEGVQKLQMGDQLRVGPLEFLVTHTEKAVVKQTKPTADLEEANDDEMAGMVNDWLEEEATSSETRPAPEPETREYKLDDTDVNVDVAEQKDEQPAKQEKNAENPSVGKLPKKPAKDAPKDTQEAAAQMLRKFFNRG